MKKIEIAFAAALVICVAASAMQLPFSRNCEEIRSDTLRLHIVANSDSDEDQDIKLAVRDELLKNSGTLLTGAEGKDEAADFISQNISGIESIANDILRQGGFDYGANAYVTEMFFEQRSYENVTLPAGYYTALRIELGDAAGHNWWCVVYPTLCVPSACEDGLDEYSDDEKEIILDEDEKYIIKFKIEEWIQQLLK